MSGDKLVFELGADVTQFESGMRKADKSLEALKVEFTRAGQDVSTKLTPQLNAASAAIARIQTQSNKPLQFTNNLREGTNAVKEMTSAVERGSMAQSNLLYNLRNTSFQVADFAVQVSGGQAAMLALSQQLPQVLGGFGALGAVLGAVVAVAGGVVLAMSATADKTAELSKVSDQLASLLSTTVLDRWEKYTKGIQGSSIALRENIALSAQAARAAASAAIEDQRAPLERAGRKFITSQLTTSTVGIGAEFTADVFSNPVTYGIGIPSVTGAKLDPRQAVQRLIEVAKQGGGREAVIQMATNLGLTKLPGTSETLLQIYDLADEIRGAKILEETARGLRVTADIEARTKGRGGGRAAAQGSAATGRGLSPITGDQARGALNKGIEEAARKAERDAARLARAAESAAERIAKLTARQDVRIAVIGDEAEQQQRLYNALMQSTEAYEAEKNAIAAENAVRDALNNARLQGIKLTEQEAAAIAVAVRQTEDYKDKIRATLAERRRAQQEQERLAREAEREAARLVRERERELAQPINQAFASIQTTMANVFDDILNGGVNTFEDLADAVRKIFTRLVADLAGAVFLEPLKREVLESLGLDSAGKKAGAGGGAAANVSGIGGVLGSISNLFSSKPSTSKATAGYGGYDPTFDSVNGASAAAGAVGGVGSLATGAAGVFTSLAPVLGPVGIGLGVAALGLSLFGGRLFGNRKGPDGPDNRGTVIYNVGTTGYTSNGAAVTTGNLLGNLVGIRDARYSLAAMGITDISGSLSVTGDRKRGSKVVFTDPISGQTINLGAAYSQEEGAIARGFGFLASGSAASGNLQTSLRSNSASSISDLLSSVAFAQELDDLRFNTTELEKELRRLTGTFESAALKAKDLGLETEGLAEAQLKAQKNLVMRASRDLIDGITGVFNDALGPLESVIRSLRIGPAGVNPAEQLKQLQAEFQALVPGALSGDAKAIANLAPASQELLDLARRYGASGAPYQDIAAQVKDVLTQVTTVQRAREEELLSGLPDALRNANRDIVDALGMGFDDLKREVQSLARAFERIGKIV